ncbi:MAG: hypothetical protein WA418_10630 [Bradyrhizobium sp.]
MRPTAEIGGSAAVERLQPAPRAIWLETRLVNAWAVAFYEQHGYRRIPNFGKYVGTRGAVCFEKRL